MQNFIKEMFPTFAARVEQNRCAFCGADMNTVEFRDEISRREAAISGLCQDCQDSTFDCEE